MAEPLITVVETKAYLAACKGVVSDKERARIVDHIAITPDSGVSIGGGVRKMRVSRPGGGKSGGFRVVFLFAGADVPTFLLTVFAKNEKTNLSPIEQQAIIAAAKDMVAAYRRRK